MFHITYLSICLSVYLPIYMSVYPPIHQSSYLSAYLLVYLWARPAICLSKRPSIYQCIYQYVCNSIYPPTHLNIYSNYLQISQKHHHFFFYITINKYLYLRTHSVNCVRHVLSLRHVASCTVVLSGNRKPSSHVWFTLLPKTVTLEEPTAFVIVKSPEKWTTEREKKIL